MAQPKERAEAEKIKRRSLLPKPGSSRYSTRLQTASNLVDRLGGAAESPEDEPTPSSIADVETSKQDAPSTQSKLGRLRPRSMYQPNTTSDRHPDTIEKQTTQKLSHPSALASKRSIPTSSITTLSRSQSLRKPTTTTGNATQTSGVASHSRTQSTSILANTNKDAPKLHSVASERPKSFIGAPSSHVRPSGIIASTALSQTRTSTRLTSTNRPINGKSKTESGSTGVFSNPASKNDEISSARLKRRETAAEEPRVLHRPAFSTLQQHFTPRKTSKAPTATFLHSAVSSSNQTLPADAVSLQCELLQLHLLHRSANSTNRDWEASAKRSLRAKFEEVVSLHRAMLDDEHERQEQKNLQSLLDWSTGTSSIGLVEHIQALSGPLHDLPSLVEPGGRLQRLVDDFEQWAKRVEELRFARTGSSSIDQVSGTVDGLGESWKNENMALTRKLTSFARDLESLSMPSSESSISRMVDLCKSLLQGILDELQIMQAIEAHVVDTEKFWVEAQLENIAQGFDAPTMNNASNVAAWQC